MSARAAAARRAQDTTATDMREGRRLRATTIPARRVHRADWRRDERRANGD